MGTKHHRLSREYYKGRVCASFTLCLERRTSFFTTTAIVRVFVGFLEKVADKHDFKAIYYCFMPDHAHLISLGSSVNTDLLRAVQQFKQYSGFWLAVTHPVVRWQKSFYDRIIRADELHTQIAYVLDNPVRWGLVDDWRKYPFTGAVGLDLEEFLQNL